MGQTRQLSQKPWKQAGNCSDRLESSHNQSYCDDGGIMLHETIMRHSKSTYAIMARDLLVKICSYHGEQVHLVLDKQSPSIKDTERNLHYSGTPKKVIITGPDRAQRQSGAELLKNSSLPVRASEQGNVIGLKTPVTQRSPCYSAVSALLMNPLPDRSNYSPLCHTHYLTPDQYFTSLFRTYPLPSRELETNTSKFNAAALYCRI